MSSPTRKLSFDEVITNGKKDYHYDKKEYRKQLIISACSIFGTLGIIAVARQICVAHFGAGPHDSAPIEYVVAGIIIAVAVVGLVIFIRAIHKVGMMNKDRYSSSLNRLTRR